MSFRLSLSFRKANGELSVTLLSRSKVAGTAALARAVTGSSSVFSQFYTLFLPELGEILTVMISYRLEINSARFSCSLRYVLRLGYLQSFDEADKTDP